MFSLVYVTFNTSNCFNMTILTMKRKKKDIWLFHGNVKKKKWLTFNASMLARLVST